MIKKALTLFFLTLPLLFFAQEKKLDSIKELLKTYKHQDTNRVSMLIDLTTYHQTRVIDSSLPLINEALEISKKIDYKRGEGYSLNALTTYHVLKGNHDIAIETAMKAREILTGINDKDNLIFNNNLLARIYMQTNELEKALELSLETVQLVEAKPSSPEKAGFHFYVAKMYQNMGDLDNAEKYYNNALEISKEVNFETGISIAKSSLGPVYIDRKEFKKALKMGEASLEFYKTHNQEHNIANSQLIISQAHAGLGDYKKAISINGKAIEVYKRFEMLPVLKSAYKLQSEYYEDDLNYKESNAYLKLHYAIVDSLFSEDKVKIVEDLQTKYETDKIAAQKETAEAKADLAQAESDQNRFYFIGAVVIGALILLSSLFFFGRVRAKKKAELITLELRETQKRLALEKQYRDSELKALKAQMNPHFIFNALNSIQEYIILNKKDMAGDYLGKFADLIRKYLHHSDSGTITIQEEIDSLEMYLDLETLRFEDKLSHRISATETLNTEALQIPTMLVQPYVENALKHGLLHKKDNRVLDINFSEKDEKSIECIIEDNGVGREKAAELKAQSNKLLHKSFATRATESRLDLLNYGKEKKIGVEIIDMKNETGDSTGTKVILTIPIVKS